MKDATTILKAYEEGDLTQRLYMFLEHRSLREEFTDIDLREMPSGITSREGAADKTTRSVFSRALAFFRGPFPCRCLSKAQEDIP